jgi:hypothetical protein
VQRGTGAFTDSAPGNVVTLTDPGVQDLEASSPVFIAMQGNDSAGLALKYSATGLPSGLTMGASNGRITGVLGSSASTSKVKVTATDSTGAVGTVTFSIVAAKPLTTGYHVVSGPLGVDVASGGCLQGAATKLGTSVELFPCTGKSPQSWEFEPDGNPGGAGTFVSNNQCMDLYGDQTVPFTYVVLDKCTDAPTQKWMIVGSAGQLYNPAAKLCLADPDGSTHSGQQVWVWDCDGQSNQAWNLSASPVQSGIAGMCVDDNHDSTTSGNKIQVWGCLGNHPAQQWTDEPDETLRLDGGKCMTVTGTNTRLDGDVVKLETCGSPAYTTQQWVTGPGGDLINVNSGLCLTDPGNNSTQGTALVQQDCYGLLGQIWAIT